MPDFEQPTSHPPHVVLVVDESGSMAVSRETTVSAINDYLQGLKSSLPADARVTVVKFDSGMSTMGGTVSAGAALGATLIQPNPVSLDTVRIEKLFDRVRLGEVRLITPNDYTPRGMTPLYDAIGRTVTGLDETLTKEPAPVYLGIITDGAENSSREFRLETVRKMIEERVERGWTFAFLGVDIDAYAAGSSFGIKAGDTVQLSRSKLDAGIQAYAASTSRKFGAFAASGADMKSYATWNKADDTFGAEDKKSLES